MGGDREISGIKLCSYQLGTAREQGCVPQQSLVLYSDSYAWRWLSAQHQAHDVQSPAACLFVGLETDDSYGLTLILGQSISANYVCVYVCLNVGMCVHIHVCGGQELMFGYLPQSPFTLFLIQSVSLNLDFSGWARLAGRPASSQDPPVSAPCTLMLG